MKRFISILTTLCVMQLHNCLIAAPSTDSMKTLASMQVDKSPSIDIRNIALRLQFDWKKKQAFGTASITFSTLKPSDNIILDASLLSIHSVTLSDGTSLAYQYDGKDTTDGLLIKLNRLYTSNEILTVVIDYHTNWINQSDPNNLWGSFGKGIRFFESTAADPTKRKQIWTMGEPSSNRYWFPCYDASNDLRTTEFIATIDKKLMVVSNGILMKVQDNDDDTHTFFWKTDKPYANYLTSFVIGDFVDIQQSCDDIALHNYGYADEVAAVKASTERLPDMVRYFSNVTGVKYPYSTYSQVFVQDFASWMGNHTVSTITENMIDDDRTHNDFYYLWDLTEAEALAHQWFGNYLTSKDWSEIWLSKSFSHYFNSLYNEQKNGIDEFLLYQLLYDQNTVYMGDWNAGYRHPVVTKHFEDIPFFVTDNYAGIRGALVLHMLRKYLGDAQWWKAIQLYVTTHANQLVTTTDFIQSVEKVNGEKMDWFFDQWIYKMGHPIFEITKEYNSPKKELVLVVKQTQTIDKSDAYPQTSFFKGKVDIEINDTIVQIWLDAKAENTFTFPLEEAPSLVHFDVGNTWIKECTFNKNIKEYLYQFQHDKDIIGRNLALTELVKIAQKPTTSSTDRSTIIDAFRAAIQSNLYWRFRVNVLSQLRNLLIPSSNKKSIELDTVVSNMLLSVVKNEKSWLRASAITFLGSTRNAKYINLYTNALKDESDRVINAAAIALGKTKNKKVYKTLVQLKDKSSWKNQSLISALNGLKELGDQRAYPIAFNTLKLLTSPHWTLATPIWDYRLAAAETIASFGKSADAYPIVFTLFKKALAENDIHGSFYNLQIMITLADIRAQEAFDLLKVKYENDASILASVNQFETQFKDAIKKP